MSKRLDGTVTVSILNVYCGDKAHIEFLATDHIVTVLDKWITDDLILQKN